MFRGFVHQFAAQCQWVLLGVCRHFVDKTFYINSVVIQVNVALKADGRTGVAHGVVNQQIGDVVGERFFRTTCVQSLEYNGVQSVFDFLRCYASKIDCPAMRMRSAVTFPRYPGPRSFCVARQGGIYRAICLLHAFTAASPAYLGFAWQLHSLANPVRLTASTKAAAQAQFVDFTLRCRQAGSFGRSGQCCLTVLGRCPHFATLRRVVHSGVHGLHNGVVLERTAVC